MLLDPYEFQPVAIVNIVRESEKAVSVQLAMPQGYKFVPGQHAIIRIETDGTKLMRQYSFSSAPSSGELWITVVETPNGAVSTWFNQRAEVGDTIEMSKPFTGPLVHDSPRGKTCMIAGGSGIAPLMSKLREIRSMNQSQPVALLYSTRSKQRCFEQELVPTAHENIVVKTSDVSGRINLSDIISILEGCSCVYICGSRLFVTDMKKLCQQTSPGILIYDESFTLS